MRGHSYKLSLYATISLVKGVKFTHKHGHWSPVYQFIPRIYLNAEMAAVAPSPADDINCDTEFWRISPAAKMPSTDVAVESGFVLMYPKSFCSKISTKRSALGLWPMAIKTPSTLISQH